MPWPGPVSPWYSHSGGHRAPVRSEHKIPISLCGAPSLSCPSKFGAAPELRSFGETSKLPFLLAPLPGQSCPQAEPFTVPGVSAAQNTTLKVRTEDNPGNSPPLGSLWWSVYSGWLSAPWPRSSVVHRPWGLTPRLKTCLCLCK